MQVFICWSGERSKYVAEFLEKWLKRVIQATDPWISTDIEKGIRWTPEIAERLSKSKVGIICLTKDNLSSTWIHFEAGSIAKTKDAHVCTLLLDLKSTDIQQPLSQFQHTTTEKDEIKKLLYTINNLLKNNDEKSLDSTVLDDIFETNWPQLEAEFNKAKELKTEHKLPVRSEVEMIQEILSIVRNLAIVSELVQHSNVKKLEDIEQGLSKQMEATRFLYPDTLNMMKEIEQNLKFQIAAMKGIEFSFLNNMKDIRDQVRVQLDAMKKASMTADKVKLELANKK